MNADVLTHIGLYSGIDERLALGIPPRPLRRNVKFDTRMSMWHWYRQVQTNRNTVHMNYRMFAKLPDMDEEYTFLYGGTTLRIHYASDTLSAVTVFRMVTTTTKYKSGDIASSFDIDVNSTCPIRLQYINQKFKNGRWELDVSHLSMGYDNDILELHRWANKLYGLIDTKYDLD
jgi:hypothetical protein